MCGSLTSEELQELKKRGYPYSVLKNFVETGTYKAESSILAAKEYENVYTIEIHEPLYIESKKHAESEGITNITFLLGDSLEQLKNIIPTVASEGAVFFIDAHISGQDSSWNEKIQVPMIEELDIILSEKLGPSVFIFNDLRLWKGKVWDWAHITNESIIHKFKTKNIKLSSFFEKDDRFYVFTK